MVDGGPEHTDCRQPFRTGHRERAIVLQFDRRTFLLASGAVLLGACSDSAGSASQESSAPAKVTTKSDGYTLAQRFSQDVIVPGTPRLPFSLANDQALLSDGPATLYGEVRDSDGKV